MVEIKKRKTYKYIKPYIFIKNKEEKTMEKEDKKINVFAKNTEKADEQVESVEKKEEVQETSGRKVIDEAHIESINWINLPKKAEVGKVTDEIKILPNGYYTQKGKHFTNKKTGKEFYSGLLDKDKSEVGEYIIEGMVGDELSRVRIPNWELVYKMSALVRYCRDNNFTIANQIISFKRVNGGTENAGENWEILIPSLKKKVVGRDNSIQDL